MMEVTDVKIIYATINDKKIKAYASVVFDACFIVRDLKVILGDTKMFVAMPSKKMKNNSYRDIVNPLTGSMRQKIETAVLDAFKRATIDT